MFNFGKIEEDPQKGLDKARKDLNSGLTGGLTKLLMGQGFMDQMNGLMDKGEAAIAGQKMAQVMSMTGVDAEAEVLGVEDTGMMINTNPVVRLKLKVTPAAGGAAFETTGDSVVSKIGIPRIGDRIRLKYDPADPSQIIVM